MESRYDRWGHGVCVALRVCVVVIKCKSSLDVSVGVEDKVVFVYASGLPNRIETVFLSKLKSIFIPSFCILSSFELGGIFFCMTNRHPVSDRCQCSAHGRHGVLSIKAPLSALFASFYEPYLVIIEQKVA